MEGSILAGGKSTYCENSVLGHAMGKTSWTMPAAIYLALCTSIPTAASTGTTIVEASYTGYARKQIAAADLNAASAGQMTNANAITFAACSGSTSTIIAFAICDAATVGNVIYWGSITSKVIDVSNTPATVAAGALVLTES